MIAKLICPNCRRELVQQPSGWNCPACQRFYPYVRGVLSFLDDGQSFNPTSYVDKQEAAWSESAQLRDKIRKSPFLTFINELRIRFSFSGRRDRIFFNEMRGGDPKKLILDIGCGGGRHYFTNYGQVVGIDPVMDLLQISKTMYPEVYHGSATALPFADESFDYVVSSDVIGHIPWDIKDQLFAEMHRVLKKGGRAVHMAETDSTNCWFKFAHKHPDLFQKHLIDKPGHISLELPTKLRERFLKHGFKEIKFKRISANVQECGMINSMFGNEFAERSAGIRCLVGIDWLLSRSMAVKEVINFFLEPLGQIDDLLTPLDDAAGGLVIYEK